MNLFRQTADFLSWFCRVIGRFVRVKQATTLTVLAASVLSRATNMLAFLLPLKIVLLAGSDGVPRYFQFIGSIDRKEPWILGLSIGAIACYVATLLLDALTKRLSQIGALEVLEGANKLAVVSNQRAEAQGYFSRFTQLAADLVFGAAGLLTILVLDPWLFAYLLSLFGAMFLFSAYALRYEAPVQRKGIAAFIEKSPRNYLKVLSSITFLSAFLVILYPFLVGGPASVLISVVLIVLMRRTFGALVDAASEAARLVPRRHLIDTLLFEDQQLRIVEAREHRTLRDVFKREERQLVIDRALRKVLDLKEPVEVRWSDPPMRGLNTFALTINPLRGARRKLQLQVFSSRMLHLKENEELLFAHVPREALAAPEVIARFSHGPYDCQICEHGLGRMVPLAQWQRLSLLLFARICSCEPPVELIGAYGASHLLLQERLTHDLIARMDVAADDATEEKVLEQLQALLPRIRAELDNFPLQIAIPDLSRRNVVLADKIDCYVMSWGRWMLEPMGASLPLNFGPDEIDTLLEWVRAKRPGIPADLTADHLAFARACRALERAITQGTYKAALRLASKIVADPVLQQTEAVEAM